LFYVAVEDRRDVFDKKLTGRTRCRRYEGTRYYKSLYYAEFLNFISSLTIFNTINHKIAVPSRNDRYETLMQVNAVKTSVGKELKT